MKEREPLPAWIAEEQHERLRMEKVMADIEYLREKYSLDADELGEIAKAELRICEQIDKAEQLMREKVKKELSGT